ncbi:MAG: hypothetical protein AAGI06_02490 [Pseudomonadota bacterium]
MTKKENANQRVTISAKISPEAAVGWRNFCDQNGISVAAMLEIAGQQLAEEAFPPRVEERRKMVELAREVDRVRRDRRRS